MINVSLRAVSDIPNTIRTNKILYLMCDSLQGLGQLGCQAGQRGMALPDGFYSRRQPLAKPVLLTPRLRLFEQSRIALQVGRLLRRSRRRGPGWCGKVEELSHIHLSSVARR